MRRGPPFGTFAGMRSWWMFFMTVSLVACGPRAQPAQPERSSAPSAETESDEFAGESGDVDPSSEEQRVSTTTTPTRPRRLTATRDRAHVELDEGTGFLVDATAPPPPPGATPGSHPTLHGSCGGDPLGCSEAGTVVRRARTLDEVRAGLEGLGFTVTIE